MPTPGMGYDAWASFKKEVTYATDPGGARDFYLRLVSETMKPSKNFQKFPGMSGPGIRGHFAGNIIVNGDVAVEFHYVDAMRLLVWAMGGYAFVPDTPVAGANTHTITMGTAATLTSFSMEISKGNIPSGDVFLYKGCIINSLTLSWANQQLIGLTVNIIAKTETPDVAAVGSPTYASDVPVLWHHTGQLLLVGSSSLDMKEGSLTINNNMTPDRFLMGQSIAQPVRGDNRTVEGSVVFEFTDLTVYNKFVAGTSGSFQIAFTSTLMVTGSTPYSLTIVGTDSLVLSAEPNVSEPGPIDLPVNFSLRSATSEITATLVNDDTTYA